MKLIDGEITKISVWNLFNDIYNNANRFSSEETEFAKRILIDVQKKIESQPICFDTDRVIEQLEEAKQDIALIYPTDQGYDYDEADGIEINKAIDIVKSGGAVL